MLRKRQVPSQSVRYEYSTPLVMSSWLLRMGSISSGDEMTITGRAPAQAR